MKIVNQMTIDVGFRLAPSVMKALVRDLRNLEAMLVGEPLKLTYTVTDGTRVPVFQYEIKSSVSRAVNWSWNTTLSHEIERGGITTVPMQFATAVHNALENQKVKKDNEKITNAKKVLAGLSEAERKLVLDSVSKPKAPRKVRDPAQKLLNAMIDGKKPPLPKDGDGKKRVVKSREKSRSEKPTPAQIRKAAKATDEKAA